MHRSGTCQSSVVWECRQDYFKTSNVYTDNDFIFQQDGAASSTSHRTRRYLADAEPAFTNKDEWPPHSPESNSMDYWVCNSLSEKVYEGTMDKFTEEEINIEITEKWRKITLELIQSRLSSSKKRQRAVWGKWKTHYHLFK